MQNKYAHKTNGTIMTLEEWEHEGVEGDDLIEVYWENGSWFEVPKKSKREQSAARQRRFKQSMRDNGFVSKNVWVHQSDIKKFDEFCGELLR